MISIKNTNSTKLEIQDLKLIYCIEKTGNLTKAAKEMYLTQPALSHKLKKIEELFEVQFFKRVNNKMIMTDAGKILLKAAEDILPKLEFYEKQLSQLIKGEYGELTISTECYTAYHWLPPVLSTFNKKYPNISINISTEATKNPLKHLLEGKIDIGLLINPSTNNNLNYFKLLKDEMLLVVHKNHHLIAKKYIEANDLTSEKFIMYDEPFEDNFFAKNILIPKNVIPEKVIKLQLTEAIIEMVKAGLRVTVMSKWLANPFIDNKDLYGIKIEKKGLYRNWIGAIVKINMMPNHVLDFITFF